MHIRFWNNQKEQRTLRWIAGLMTHQINNGMQCRVILNLYSTLRTPQSVGHLTKHDPSPTFWRRIDVTEPC